jgi:hypothetical protein
LPRRIRRASARRACICARASSSCMRFISVLLFGMGLVVIDSNAFLSGLRSRTTRMMQVGCCATPQPRSCEDARAAACGPRRRLR